MAEPSHPQGQSKIFWMVIRRPLYALLSAIDGYFGVISKHGTFALTTTESDAS